MCVEHTCGCGGGPKRAKDAGVWRCDRVADLPFVYFREVADDFCRISPMRLCCSNIIIMYSGIASKVKCA